MAVNHDIETLPELHRQVDEAPAPRACLHELFLAQAARTPDAPAVSDPNVTLTYRELARRSARLARRLIALGAGPETVVGVAMPRTADLIATLLGVLRTGAAYVPLDLAYPEERVAFMVEDADVRVVVVPDDRAHRLPAGLGGRGVVIVPPEMADPGADGDPPLPLRGSPEHLAYLIYTSGSTGRPKGVAIEHRSAAAFLRWCEEVFSPEETAAVFAATSINFDLSIYEIFLPLSRGGRVIVGENALALAGHPLAAEATLLNTVPSAATELLRLQAIPPSVRTVNLAGEPLRNILAQGLYGLGTVERVWNLYGPSEDTTYSTAFLVEPGADEEPLIGKPIRWTRGYVVDPGLRLVTDGTPGELCLAGAGLARCYLGRPDQTAERFVPDPFSAEPGGRMYRTGDLVRLRPSGDLDFLGRIDHQVKIRGFRVELGEVEAALLAQPGVREAAVMARDTDAGKELVAYIAGIAGEASPGDIRAALRSRLPGHMVPTAWAVLDALPLTPNGKIDRRALARIEPVAEMAAPTEDAAAPRTVTEEILAGLWGDVLGLERVGIHDGFLDLGGHSLLGTRLLARVSAAFHVDLPLPALFEAGTVAGLAERIDAALAGGDGAVPPVRPVPRNGFLPLAPAQESLWMVDRLGTSASAYNIPVVFELRGDPDPALLSAALDEIVRRHEALRTSFPMKDGRPCQDIHPFPPSGYRTMPVVDLRALPDPDHEASRVLAEAARLRFDLERGPLVRSVLLRKSHDGAVLFVGLHHTIGDGGSVDLLAREVAALYRAFAEGGPSPLPPLPVQYADYVVWLRGRLAGGVLEEHFAWWMEELRGAPTRLDLPFDRPRPAIPSGAGRTETALLDAEPVLALSRSRGATPFMTILAAFQTLLHRYTGIEDIVVGAPVSHRPPGTEGLIGLFVNSLPLRARFETDPPFAALLDRTRETTLAAIRRQEAPFDRLVDELRLERSLSYTPLVQVLVAQQNPPEVAELPGLTLVAREGHAGSARTDLTFSFAVARQGIEVELEYGTELFDTATLKRLIGHFRTLLEGAAADPGRRVSELPLLLPAERHQLLAEWNDARTAFPAGRCVHELFEEQAALRPGAPALSFGRDRFTYAELDDRAGRLARHLREAGVEPGAPVALYLERSPETIVTLLAILKAGGCYVPLDTAYPEDRLAFMLEDSGARVLVTLERWLDRFPGAAVKTVCLDRDAEAIARRTPERPVSGAFPEGPAYVLYTSGSTGRPKGVAVPHRAVVRLVRENDFLRLGPDDVMAQASNISFDAATLEIWGPLLNGGRLAIVSKDTLLSPAGLAAWLRDEGVTALFLTTALFNQVAGALPGAFHTLRAALFGGEAADAARVRQVLRAAPPGRLINGYGPTESTTFAATYDAAEVPESARSLPIGRPLSNTSLWVLDRWMQPVPLGVTGELYLGGDGLALGYAGRPELTAERFLPHPLGTAGERVYKTGDLVRWRADGFLEYLGRTDFQVKIRGFRIELGEVEGTLAAHPLVREAAVLALGEADKRLAAYVGAPAAPAPAELRAWLAERLPPFMVPAEIVVLDALPLTPNGKADRKALARIEPRTDTAPDAPAAPRTPTEEVLVQIWADLLGRERVGVEDGFFDLGGHSLLAMRLVSRVGEAFQVELPLRTVFEAPTPAGLAARVEEALARGTEGAPPPLARVARDGRLPLSFSQERLWFLDRLLEDRALYNVPFVLALSGDLDRDALKRSLEEIVRRHESLRTVFPEDGGVPHQEIVPFSPALVPLPETDLRALPRQRRAAEMDRLRLEGLSEPFDLARGPLIRVRLVLLEEGEAALLLTLHHIVSDGWSIEVLLDELRALYGAFAAGRPSPLPELPVQFADFAAWQRSWLRDDRLRARLAHWVRELAGAPTRLELPADRPRPAVLRSEGGEIIEPLPATLAGALRALARRSAATPFMVFLAGFQALLHRLTGQEDVLVGSPFAGRDRRETEGLIGFFVNTLVLRGRMPEGTRFRDLVEQARSATLAAHTHQDLPFEKLVEELRIERSLSHTPLFQVLFTHQDVLPEAIELPGLVLRPLPAGTVAVKFDLTLTLVETPEGGIAATVRYLHDLFDDPTPARFLEQLKTLLAGAAADPDRPLGRLPLLPEAERHQVLREHDDTARASRETSSGRTVVERFEEWAERTPDAPALAFEGETLSYRELAGRTGRLAARLRAMGVGPEVPVAVCLERSLAMIEAVLGVLRAGGAYVPIDPDFPEERIAYIVEDSGARVVLTAESLARLLEDPSPALPCFAGEGASAREEGALAYLIYTSGSTGRPKGVAVEHRQLSSYLDGVLERMALPPGSSYATVSTIAADLGNTVVFAALATGGCLHVISRERLADGDALGEYFERHGIDCLKIVPSHLAALLASSRPASCLPRKLLVVGGESTRWELADRVRELAPSPDFRLLNHYGPTETTVGVLTREIGAHEPGRRRQPNIPLGRPIQGTRIVLLDPRGEPVPLGVPGELHVGGDNVSRGYLNRPDLTAARFVPDPFDPFGQGARLYATGDLARRRPDGMIEFLGRVDHQVKVRGYRVELGEIEAALAAHPDVQGAAVLARETAPGDLRLVAFVAPRAPRELASWLRERLPDAMVPAVFVPLETLPLTANGKVDRRALEAVPVSPETLDAGDDAPRSAAEEIVAGIFADLLGLERVGYRGHFFDLGGHSLLATRALSRLRDAFQVELSLRALFEEPTVAGLAARINAALARGRDLLAPPIRPVPAELRPADLPLSFAQERLWLLDRLQPGRAVYNVPFVYRLSGGVDLGTLERSLGEIVRRHEVLRSRFPDVDGRPVQRVLPFQGFTLPRVDLRGLPNGQEEADRLVEQETRRPFDLARGPLFRGAVLLTPPPRDAEDTAVLSFHLHHIVSDGWSRAVFRAELSALYAGETLPELPVQYADFAVWQRDWMRGEVLERQIAFWKAELDGAPRLLELPSDRPRPAVQSFRGGLRALELPHGTVRAVRALARRQGATLFMTLLAAWQALLCRISGQDDVLVGTPVSGRNHSEIEGLIGFFVNTLVLRGRIDDGADGATFRDMVVRAKAAALSTYAHQELPFERLVEELSVERSLSHNPLFQVMFVLEDSPGRPLPPGLELEPVALGTGTAKFDLGLAAAALGDQLDIALEYATDLFDPATADRILGWLATLLDTVAADPDARVADVPLLAGRELQQVVREWNDSAIDTSGPLVHHQVETRAARLPDAEAVMGVSYRELNARANRLAHHLRRLGVKPETRVGVLVERSADLIVAELAVLKAGGAFVPLDASHPVERMAFTLEDSRCPVLLARESLVPDTLRGRPGLLVLPPESWGAGGDPDSDPEPWATERNLAYVIYTSGSTGRPKGVEIEHASLRNLASWHRAVYGLGPADRASLVSSPAFDASVWEVWPYLVSGAALRIPDEETRAHPARLVAWLAEQEITLAFLSAPMAEAAWAETWPADMPLRVVFTGADKVHQGPPPGLGLKLVNAYGPTEATVVVTACDVPPGAVSPPIGRSFANARVLLLDARLQPVPLGVPGELCVAGPNLARGYAGRPDLTADRFLPDPLGGAGERLYRTGDLARWRADGNLEYLGRIDQQVKIRGFRIELGEVESALGAHPGLRAAAVLALGTVDRRLAAYVVPAEGAEGEIHPAELRTWLAGRLPEPMVPTAWVVLPELPLTSNGKVDRRALARIEPEIEETFDPPATPTEEILCALWSELLGVERVGTGANFFDLGGHSLKATQLVSRVASALGVDLPVRAVFETPTVAELAARLDAMRLAGEGLQAPPIRPVPRAEALPLSYNQEPIWFLSQVDPESAAYNVFTPLKLTGALDEPALLGAVEEVVRRHESLRTVFEVRVGVPFQRALPPSARTAVVDLRALPGDTAEAEARRLAGEEARRPFDLLRGPVFRATLVRTAPASSLLLLNAHHIVTDGWSNGVLLRELSALYTAAVSGGSADLPDLPVQYADFAVWQREWLRGEILERQVAFWRKALAGAPPLLALPTDRPRPARPSFRGGVVTTVIPKEAADPLREASRRLGSTLFMTCLAAYQLLLHRYTGQDDVVVGTPVANRGRGETEDVIGCFINTLALRGRLDRPEAGLTFRELLARVRATALDAYVYQDLPFEKVVEALKVERSLRWNPVFQVFFTLSPPVDLPRMAGLGLEALDEDTEVAKFDLALGLAEVGDEIWGGIRYSAELFDAETIETMLARYRALLEQAAADPDRPLAELAPWSDAERKQILAEPEETGEALETRLASRGQKVEDLRAHLSDRKKAMLAKLIQGKKRK